MRAHPDARVQEAIDSFRRSCQGLHHMRQSLRAGPNATVERAIAWLERETIPVELTLPDLDDIIACIELCIDERGDDGKWRKLVDKLAAIRESEEVAR